MANEHQDGTAAHDLAHLVEQATAAMSAEYARIRARASEDPGTAGDEGEENWAQILRHWLPASYHVVTKGRILSSDGTASPQLDILVLSPSYPVGLLNRKLYLAAAVLAAFECKNTLRLSHLPKVVRTGATVRELMRDDPAVDHRAIYGLLAHSHGVANRHKSVEDSISDALQRADLAAVFDPRDCLDFLCVADVGTWSLMRGAFGDEGMIYTTYMGPIGGKFTDILSVSGRPNSLGRLLTGLLRRLGSTDPTLKPIGDYLDRVGLFGIGQGTSRAWPIEELAEDALTVIV